MRMMRPYVIFKLRTAVKAQVVAIPTDHEILLFRTINWMGKEGYLFHDVINEKETGKAITLQLNILETAYLSNFKTKKQGRIP
jgi:hypothetical protein